MHSSDFGFLLKLQAFTMVSCSMTGGCEWYMAKPWVGFFSCVTVLLSVGAATGCMALAGVPLIGIDLAAPFLMLGNLSLQYIRGDDFHGNKSI